MPKQTDKNAIIDGLLEKLGVDHPPIPVEKIASNLGIQVVKSPLPDDMSGLLYREKDGKHTVIGVNSMHAPVRQRFTIAHEIGHFHLHSDEVHVDRLFPSLKGASVRFRDQRSSAAADRAEIQANRFAAALLMPEQFIRSDMKKTPLDMADEDTLALMAKRYGVSQHALAIRLVNLGYLHPDILNVE